MGVPAEPETPGRGHAPAPMCVGGEPGRGRREGEVYLPGQLSWHRISCMYLVMSMYLSCL